MGCQMQNLRTVMPAVWFLYFAVVHADQYELAFKEFVERYGREYASPTETQTRFVIFKENFQFIEAENAKNLSYRLVVNDFADKAPEELRSTHLGLSLPSPGKLWVGLPHLGTHNYSGEALPAAVDWVEKGAVTPVKNQKRCGSCWAFSTTGSLEGAWQIKTGKLLPLSEQQLVDCSAENHGCGGGSMDLAFSFLETQHVCAEQSYPYHAVQATCKAVGCQVGIPKGGIAGFKDVRGQDESALMDALSRQPVSVAIEADEMAFQLYSHGVLTKACGHKLDHGVLAVGYGTDGGVNYWKVKNSWGAQWGESGYVRIERGLPGPGECGIKSMASYPVVRGSHGPSPGPSPPAPPSPAPPAPPAPQYCSDIEAFCTNPDLFDPSEDCEIWAPVCKQTCGCCEETPSPRCNGPITKSNATATIVLV